VSNPTEEAELIKLFNRLDKNSDGKLSKKEISDGSASLGLTS